MLSLNPRVGHFMRSGANLVSRRGAGTLPTRPDQFACRNLASTSHLTRFIPGSTSIDAAGAKVAFTHADVGTEAACLAFVNGAGEKFGRLDILINNAGIRKYEKVDEANTASWNEILSVNHSRARRRSSSQRAPGPSAAQN